MRSHSHCNLRLIRRFSERLVPSGMMATSAPPFSVGGATLVALHAARADQKLTPEGNLLKVVRPEAPSTCIPAADRETPAEVVGIVRARRIVAPGSSPHRSIEEHRELCSCELFDCVAAAGGVDLTQGCAPVKHLAHYPRPPLPDIERSPYVRRLTWFSQLAKTILQCHAHGLLHGQLRPEHVLLDDDSHIKLLGFEPPSWRQLRRGASKGSAHVLRPIHHLDAPELHGRSHAPAAKLQVADVWGLGVLGTAIIAGRPPLVTSHGGIEMPIGMQGVPVAVILLLESMLSAAPAERPPMQEVMAQASALTADLRRQLPLAAVKLGDSSCEGARVGGLALARTDSKLSEMSDAPTRPPSLVAMASPTLAPAGAAKTPRMESLQAKLRTLEVLSARPRLEDDEGAT